MPDNNSFSTSRDLGVLNGAIAPITDFVGTDDRNDFYKFVLQQNSNISFALTGLESDPAQLQIVADSDGDNIFTNSDVIQDDTVRNGSSSTDDRFIDIALSPGTYWARVVTWYDSQNTDYTLTTEATPRTSDNSTDPGDTYGTALNIGGLTTLQTFSDAVDPTDRNDFYQFSLAQNSDVSLVLSDLGSEPAQLQIVADSDGDGIFTNADVIHEDTVSNGSSSTADRSITTALSEGTYWARVVTWYDTQNTGYTLTAEATPRTGDNFNDPGDTYETALDMGNLGAPQTFSDAVDPTDRNDFYRFTLTENSDISLILSDLGPEPAQLQIFADWNNDGAFTSSDVIHEDTVSNGSGSTADRSITTPLTGGTYWARVVTWYDTQNTGYTLTAEATPRTGDNATDPGDTYETALDMGNLGALQTFSDAVDPTDRNDFYQFTLIQNSDVSLILSDLGPEPAQLQIFADWNNDGAFTVDDVIHEDTVSNGSGSTADRSITTPLSEGTYWARVVTWYDTQNTGYTLTAEATPRTGDNAIDPGDTYETALDMGNLGAPQTFSDAVDPTDRNDFYQFTLTQNSDVSLILSNLGPEPAQLQIFADWNNDGAFTSSDVIHDDTVSNGSSSTADRSITTPLSEGTYWARVVTWYDRQNTGYTLTAEATPRTGDNATDPGDTYETALDMGNLGALQTFSDAVDPTDRNDFYQFTLAQNSDVSFALTGLGPEPAQLQIIADLDGNGDFSSSDIIEEDNVSNGSSSTADRFINKTLSAGTYWARVVTWYDSQNTGYTLAAQATPTGGTVTEPGNELGSALDIGNLSTAQTFTDTVGSLDRNDYYTFTLDQFGQVNFTLQDLAEAAQLSLLVDFDGDGIWDSGEAIANDGVSDTSSSTASRTIAKTLAPGTYWLNVWTRYSTQNTSYTLDVAALSPLAIPTTDPSGTLATAQDIGVLSGSQSFTNFVGSRDRNDFYKFSLTEASEVSVALSNLEDDADLSLILDANNNGEIDSRDVLSQVALNDSADRNLAYPLGVGDYFVRVSTDSVEHSTAYDLDIAATVLDIPDAAGGNFSAARNLGTLTGNQRFDDYVGSIDPNDYYRFELATDSNLQIAISGEDVGNDVRLEVFDSSTNRFITSTDSTDLNLFAGTYYVRAFPRTGNTNYTIDFATTSLVDQAGNSFDNARDIGVLASEQTFSDWVGSIDANDYYRFELLNPSSFDLTLGGLDENANVYLFDSNGRWLARSINSGTNDDAMALTELDTGTYYLQVYQAFNGQNTNYTLDVDATPAAPDPFAIVSITPDSGSNSGQATVTITGAQFTPEAEVSLIDDAGDAQSATQITWQSSNTLIGTFDLTGLDSGTYDVAVTDAAGTDTAEDVFTITDDAGGQLEVTISSPRAIRPWWTGEVVVNYRNVGGSDIVAPLLSLEADNARFRTPGEAQFGESAMQFLGIHADGAAGVLPAGASGSFTVAFQPVDNIAEIDFTVSTVAPEEIVDWAALKDSAQPDTVSDDAWDVVWANFTTSVGTTAGEYQAVLAANATRLGQLGETTGDVGQLLAFELQQASNYQATVQRYEIGSLGRGQSFIGDIRTVVDEVGNVTIQNGSSLRGFELQADGSYQAEPGDYGTLTAIGGSYHLTEQDGTLVAFNSSGRLDYIEDPNANRISASYTGDRLTQLTDSLDGRLTITYNTDGRIEQVEDEVGRITRYTYDTTGEYVETITDPSGTTTYTYHTGGNKEGALASITDPEGTRIQFDYDDQGRLESQSLNDGAETITYAYDAAGGVTLTDATGESTRLLLNDRGQVGQITDPAGRAVQFRYDDLGNLTRIIGPNNSITSFAYDDQGNLVRQTDANGQQVEFAYEPTFGRLTQVTDPRGNDLQYEYDAQGNLEAIIYEDGTSEQFQYNGQGDVIQSTNRRGQTIGYTYQNGQLASQTISGFSPVTYEYDADNNLEFVTDSQGRTAMEYDTADRLTKITYPTGRFLIFDYDDAGRRIRLEDQDGNEVNYDYDAAGRLQELTDANDELIVEYQYDTVGRLARENKGNGTYSVYEYFPTGELQSLVHYALGQSHLYPARTLSRYSSSHPARNRLFLSPSLAVFS